MDSSTKQSFNDFIVKFIVFSAMVPLFSYTMEDVSEKQLHGKKESPEQELVKLKAIAIQFGWAGPGDESLTEFYGKQLSYSRQMGKKLTMYCNTTSGALIKLETGMKEIGERMQRFEIASAQFLQQSEEPLSSSSKQLSSTNQSATEVPTRTSKAKRHRRRTKVTTIGAEKGPNLEDKE
jgi:hypothetical protein